MGLDGVIVVAVAVSSDGAAQFGVARRDGRAGDHDAPLPRSHGRGRHEERAGEPRLHAGVSSPPVEVALHLEIVRTGVGTRAHGDVVVAGERDDERRRKGARAGRSGRGLPSRPVRERRAHFGNSEIGSFFRGSAVPARQN